MWTVEYKGYYIHGYFDRETCTFHKPGEATTLAWNLHVAKCRITRLLKTA